MTFPAPSTRDWLLTVLRRRLSVGEAAWLDSAREKARQGAESNWLQLYTGAARRIGPALLSLDDAERVLAAAVAPDLVFDRWTREDAARAVLLLERHEAHADPQPCTAAALACYEHGDAREQQSWARALCLLPEPDRFLATVIDVCRTNILPLFTAVACDNPYPARYFPDRNFNQVVLKALFNAVPLARIVGLRSRRNAELARMAGDYARERQAAGRTVPSDIGLVLEQPQ
jgi:hypothetical protein